MMPLGCVISAIQLALPVKPGFSLSLCVAFAGVAHPASPVYISARSRILCDPIVGNIKAQHRTVLLRSHVQACFHLLLCNDSLNVYITSHQNTRQTYAVNGAPCKVSCVNMA